MIIGKNSQYLCRPLVTSSSFLSLWSDCIFALQKIFSGWVSHFNASSSFPQKGKFSVFNLINYLLAGQLFSHVRYQDSNVHGPCFYKGLFILYGLLYCIEPVLFAGSKTSWNSAVFNKLTFVCHLREYTTT